MPKPTQRGEPQPHPREVTGRPPTFADFSPEGRKQAESEFKHIASNPHTMAVAAAEHAHSRIEGWRSRNPGKADNVYVGLEQRRAEQMETAAGLLTDRARPVTMNTAAQRLADNYGRASARTMRSDVALTGASPPSDVRSAENLAAGKGTVTPTGAVWYQEHGHDLRNIAETHGADPRTTVVGSGSMSPQNAPAYERQAAHAITAATQRGGTVSMLSHEQLADRLGVEKINTKTQRAHIAAQEALSMRPGEEKPFHDFTPEQVALMGRHRAILGGTTDYEGLAHGGTELPTGVRMLRGELGQEHLGPTGKVPSYVHQGLLGADLESLGESAPDANAVSEFNRRVHESIPGNHPYFEQSTLFGEEWEADPFGRAHSTEGILNPGHQPAEAHAPSKAAAEFFPESTAKYEERRGAGEVPLHEGTTAQDTWMMAQSLTLPRRVEGVSVNESARNPSVVSKLLGSDPIVPKFGGGDIYMPTPRGERKASAAEVQHAVFNEITNRAAGVVTQRAREAGRNVGAGVPAVAVQGATWAGYRMDVDKDPEYTKRLASIEADTRPNAAVPGETPKPGQDVPMFDEGGAALTYGKSWRPKQRR